MKILVELVQQGKIILCSDLNSREGRKTNDKAVGQFGEYVLNNNGQNLIDICEQNQLTILNGFSKHRYVHEYTWTQLIRGLKSIMSFRISRQNIQIKIQDVRVYKGP